MPKKPKLANAGFTLIELIIVIVIISLIIVIAGSAVKNIFVGLLCALFAVLSVIILHKVFKKK